MTTLAYNNGVLATDSQATLGERVYSNRSKKIFRNIGPFKAVAYVGDMELAENRVLLIAKVTTIAEVKALLDPEAEDDFSILALVSKNEAWSMGACDIFRLENNVSYALGSGASYAYAAMDLGKTPQEAIRVAAKRDIFTNSIIQTFNIGES